MADLIRRLTTLLILCTCVLPSAALGGQTPQKQTKRVPNERCNELENLLTRARSLPAEFAIDVFLRVEKSKRVDKQWRREILEEAFTLTTNVQNEVREKAIPFPNTPVDTRAGYRGLAFALNLDSLSSRSRIIDDMLAIDKSVALRMLNEISPRLSFKTLSCSAQVEYDVADFYRLIEKVARTAFDEKQIQEGERVQFVLPYVEGISSPAQITPVMNLLISLDLRQKESFIVSQSFANALKKINADDRSFSAALLRTGTTSNLFRLINWYRKTEVPYDEIISEYRSYVARHLHSTRCEDNLKLVERQIKEMNYLFPDNPLSSDESKPVNVEESPPIKAYFESSQSKNLMFDFRDLRGYDDDDPATREPYTSASWQEKMLEYLRLLEALDGSSETDAEDYFHQKCMLYRGLLRIVPAGPQSDHAVLSYLKLLGQPAVINESRIEWLWHVNELIRFIKEQPGAERVRLLNIIANSKNPVLQVYGDLAKVNL